MQQFNLLLKLLNCCNKNKLINVVIICFKNEDFYICLLIKISYLRKTTLSKMIWITFYWIKIVKFSINCWISRANIKCWISRANIKSWLLCQVAWLALISVDFNLIISLNAGFFHMLYGYVLISVEFNLIISLNAGFFDMLYGYVRVR